MLQVQVAPDSSRYAGPILVTGSHRSGSTWVGNVLSLAPGTGYVHEPFNVNTRAGVCAAAFPVDFTYVTAANEARYLRALGDTLAWRYAYAAELPALRSPRDAARMLRDGGYFRLRRLRGDRLIMKDPIALFSAEWLSTRFDMPVVTTVRHPAAFVASLIAAGWAGFDFTKITRQDRLVAERLAPFRDELTAATAEKPDPVGTGILLWRILHHHIRTLRRDHPDWIFVRHEDLAGDPVPAFRSLYARLGLRFAEDTPARIAGLSERADGFAAFSLFGSRRQVNRNSREAAGLFRKRLTDADIVRIRSESADVWPDFYGEDDW
jgi:hypothetical protein